MSRTLRILGFILSLVCLCVIVYFSFAKDVTITRYVVGQDKGGHFLAYMALGFLFFLCFCNYVQKRLFVLNLLPMLGAMSLSFLCGYAIELLQPIFGRSFETLDLLSDALGSLAGVVLCFICVLLLTLIERRRSRR